MIKIKVSFEIWVQLLGMFGVLGGLVFVGLEMQQSQRIAMAGQQQERTALSSTQLSLSLVLIGIRLFLKIVLSLADHKHAGRNNFHLGLFIYENDYFQYSQGLMPEEFCNPNWQPWLFLKPVQEQRYLGI